MIVHGTKLVELPGVWPIPGQYRVLRCIGAPRGPVVCCLAHWWEVVLQAQVGFGPIGIRGWHPLA